MRIINIPKNVQYLPQYILEYLESGKAQKDKVISNKYTKIQQVFTTYNMALKWPIVYRSIIINSVVVFYLSLARTLSTLQFNEIMRDNALKSIRVEVFN